MLVSLFSDSATLSKSKHDIRKIIIKYWISNAYIINDYSLTRDGACLYLRRSMRCDTPVRRLPSSNNVCVCVCMCLCARARTRMRPVNFNANSLSSYTKQKHRKRFHKMFTIETRNESFTSSMLVINMYTALNRTNITFKMKITLFPPFHYSLTSYMRRMDDVPLISTWWTSLDVSRYYCKIAVCKFKSSVRTLNT